MLGRISAVFLVSTPCGETYALQEAQTRKIPVFSKKNPAGLFLAIFSHFFQHLRLLFD